MIPNQRSGTILIHFPPLHDLLSSISCIFLFLQNYYHTASLYISVYPRTCLSTICSSSLTKDGKGPTAGTNEIDDKALAQEVQNGGVEAQRESKGAAAKQASAPAGLPDVPDGGLHAWLTIAGG